MHTVYKPFTDVASKNITVFTESNFVLQDAIELNNSFEIFRLRREKCTLGHFSKIFGIVCDFNATYFSRNNIDFKA